MNSTDNIKTLLKTSISVKKEILRNEDIIKNLSDVIQSISQAIKKNNFIFFCGNGGSAADAQHIAAELTGKFKIERKSLKGVVLGSNLSSMTAIANDYGYDEVFSRELSGIGSKGDILIVYSTSGNSVSIVNALKVAKKLGIASILFTGESGGLCKDIADINICVPSNDTARIQESHITLSHIILELFEERVYKTQLEGP
jgi:D-sedoheptulose 7-phosphate isomerase